VDASDYTQFRPLMFSIAYRMTGSVADAEDIVQEAFLRLAKSAEAVLLESLSPAERAVFLLREVFGFEYAEIAEVTGKTEPACRQTFARARRRIDEGRPRFETSRAEGEELTRAFLAVAHGGGDMAALIERLAPDVVFYGDSGGLGEGAFTSPLFGRDQVAQVIAAQITRTIELGASLRAARVNGQPGLLACDDSGALIVVIALDVLDGQVQAIRAVANPEKLRHLVPVSRAWHLRSSGPGPGAESGTGVDDGNARRYRGGHGG